jgi:hypothetical protein
MIHGLGIKDFGCKTILKREVIRKAKLKGYKTSEFHKMGRKQLMAINRKMGGGWSE